MSSLNSEQWEIYSEFFQKVLCESNGGKVTREAGESGGTACRYLQGDRLGFAYRSGSDESCSREACRRAKQNARYGMPTAIRSFATMTEPEAASAGSMGNDREVTDVPDTEVQAVFQTCRERYGSGANVSLSMSKRVIRIRNSEGLFREEVETKCVLQAENLNGGGILRVENRLEDLLLPEEPVVFQPVADGEGTLIVGQAFGRLILPHLSHWLVSEWAGQRRPAWLGKAPFRVFDLPHKPGREGRCFDDEGTLTQPIELVSGDGTIRYLASLESCGVPKGRLSGNGFRASYRALPRTRPRHFLIEFTGREEKFPVGACHTVITEFRHVAFDKNYDDFHAVAIGYAGRDTVPVCFQVRSKVSDILAEVFGAVNERGGYGVGFSICAPGVLTGIHLRRDS